jgi:N-acetylglucosaminyl-diphospho-decaprenol L-rhamnosyltransferase
LGGVDAVRDGAVKASLIVVCHHSSAELPRCLETFRRHAAAAGVEVEVVVVEQSEDEDEAEAAAACRPDTLLVRPNRGYAAGLNAGMTAAEGEVLLLANPDIRFLDDSVGPLVAAATGGADVAGPQLLWDEGGEVLLPIPDDPAPGAELARTARRRWPSWRRPARLLDASWQVWTADDPCPAPSLRGPLLVLTAAAAARLGPLDEGYFLYYEETEWLWRARRRGARLALVPRSRVVHRWGHATRRRSDVAAVEIRSRARFFERNYPRLARALAGHLAPSSDRSGREVTAVAGPEAVIATGADIWLLSIVSSLEPAVGCLERSELPQAARELTATGRWYAIAAARQRDRWRPLGSWTWERA